MTSYDNLASRTAVVTGAASGMGAATAAPAGRQRCPGRAAGPPALPRRRLGYDQVGGDGDRTDWERTRPPGFHESGGAVRVAGSGDIAPLGADGGPPVERGLTGLFAGLLLVIVVAVLFITAECRRRLIRTTLLAEPRRVRVLAAKATVLAAVTFAAGLVAAGVTVPLSARMLRAGGTYVLPVALLTEVRVVAGAAAVVALSTLLAYALGALLRRGVLAVAAAALLVVLPDLLATASVLPVAAGQWLLRLTPAAGFAILQTTPAYPQVARPPARC